MQLLLGEITHACGALNSLVDRVNVINERLTSGGGGRHHPDYIPDIAGMTLPTGAGGPSQRIASTGGYGHYEIVKAVKLK
jgi:hypothetical protein